MFVNNGESSDRGDWRAIGAERGEREGGEREREREHGVIGEMVERENRLPDREGGRESFKVALRIF